ncbi:Acetylcholine receptor subunit alpha-type acr-16 [Hypsibius exemplaris]|uniref:Acetylcholine receptor subunit alpha-type acr-16 n=1 Tax=Hypsibius exemplaris TaxID=2072580 RepID=A0A1W0WQI0_HYPEX|nr:Acetylcholine receptor subunit alpha-type acr-16 [Hypsibius exemplaris]
MAVRAAPDSVAVFLGRRGGPSVRSSVRSFVVFVVFLGFMIISAQQIDYDNEVPFSYRYHSAYQDDYSNKRSSDEHKLMAHLMQNYEKAGRPVVNASTRMTVQIGFVLTQISQVDERNQVLTLNVWLEQEWVDEVLVWDPEKYGNIRTLVVPSTKLWLPDIVLYNNADDYNKNLMPVNVVLQHNGNVFWSPPTKMRSTCKIDTRFFPFDDQRCLLKLGSWIYDGYQLDVVKRKPNVDMSDYVPSGEWVIVNTTMVRNENRYDCCPEPFPDVTVTFHIRRRTAYYSYNIIAPCVMLSMLTIVLFWLPCDAGEKITLGLTVLLAFSVFMLMIGETMPETSDAMPLLGIYILSTEFIASLSVGMSVTILNFHYRGIRRNQVPNWLRRLTFRYMARITFMAPLYSTDGVLLPPKTASPIVRDYSVADAAKIYRNPNAKDPFNNSNNNNHVDRSAESMRKKHSDLEEFRRLIGLANNNSSTSYAQMSYESTQSTNVSYMSASVPYVGNSPDGDVVGRIKRLLDKFHEEKSMEENLAEWRRVAEIWDRFGFYVFVLLIFWTTVGLLALSAIRDE